MSRRSDTLLKIIAKHKYYISSGGGAFEWRLFIFCYFEPFRLCSTDMRKNNVLFEGEKKCLLILNKQVISNGWMWTLCVCVCVHTGVGVWWGARADPGRLAVFGHVGDPLIRSSSPHEVSRLGWLSAVESRGKPPPPLPLSLPLRFLDRKRSGLAFL